MLQEKLKIGTKLQHDQLEQLMFVGAIMSRSLTVEQYQQLLITNYLAHQQYESLIYNAISAGNANVLGLAEREKLGALLADLAEVDIAPTAVKTTLRPVSSSDFSEAYALGAMYVLEGATLGGSVIYKQLKLNPNFGPTFKFNYYTVYGSELLAKWQQFLQVLNALPEEVHQQVIDGAHMMFEQIAAIATAQKEPSQL